MKFTEQEFKQEVERIHNGSFEVVGHFKGLRKPITVKNKYGLLKINQAYQVLTFTPDIKSAVNKTAYFLEVLKEKQPNIFKHVKILSEYKTAKDLILCEVKYGVVSTTPDSLLSGHMPTIRRAVDRKKFFKNQLLEIYGDDYDFKVTTSNRKGGRTTIICKTHGESSVDNDYLFTGNGCPKCNRDYTDKNVLYVIELFNESETFYKVGISYKIGTFVRRFADYIKLGYSYNVLILKDFDNDLECREAESQIKKIIKPFLYTPKNWHNSTSTECFTVDIIAKINSSLNNDIV